MATWPEETANLRQQMPNVFFLMPGYGAQGATADHVAHAFNDQGYGAIINSSRGIIFAYQTPAYQERFSEERYFDAAAEAVIKMRDDLLRSLRQAGRLPRSW